MIRNYEIHRAREILRFGCQAYLWKGLFEKIFNSNELSLINVMIANINTQLSVVC